MNINALYVDAAIREAPARSVPYKRLVKWWGPWPVSYTHLDVYKRQILRITMVAATQSKSPGRKVPRVVFMYHPATAQIPPTTKDVYKRQGF